MLPQHIIDGIVWSEYPPRQVGGQHTGRLHGGLKLTHENTSFECATCYVRSQHQTKALLLNLFELYLMELKVI